MKEFCGVYGIYSFDSDNLAKSVYYGLFALQHRGQESAGIAVADGKTIKVHKGMGLCAVVFNEEILSSLSPGPHRVGPREIFHGRFKLDRERPAAGHRYKVRSRRTVA